MSVALPIVSASGPGERNRFDRKKRIAGSRLRPYKRRMHTHAAALKAPGPQGRWLLGSALDFTRDPLAFLADLARTHGDVVDFRLGPQRVVLVVRAEDVEKVLVTDADRYRKPRFVYRMGRVIFGRALSALDGDAWQRQRRVVAPVFARQHIEDYGATMVRHATAMVRGWRTGDVQRVDEQLMTLFLRIGLEVLLGITAADGLDGARGAVADALGGFAARLKGPPLPDWVPLPHHLRMRSGTRRVNALVADAIPRGRADATATNLLALLVRARDGVDGRALDDRQVRDELAVMLGLGSHQCTVAMAWTLHLLAQHPRERERVETEVAEVLGGRAATVADLARLPVVSSVVDEALRLYPPFFFFAREARAGTTIAGVHLRAGDAVGLSPWVTQRQARYFEAPDTFRPARWLRAPKSATNGAIVGAQESARCPRSGTAPSAGAGSTPVPRFAYFPFGGGPRICVANHYTLMQLRLVLATIVQHVRLESAPGARVTPHAAIALGMHDGLTMIVEEGSR
jgi:cytochrome P450